jgi:AraC-like DNA-binding protein
MTDNNDQLRSSLPLIRLSLIKPFTDYLDQRKIEFDKAFAEYGLSRENLDSTEVFITSNVMYHLLEDLARAAGDPHQSLNIGEQLDIFSWPLFIDAARDASTFGDFIFRFSMETGKQASSTTYHLETDGDYAIFRLRRVTEPDICPAQADAFYVGLFYKLFRAACGNEWDPRQVLARVCNVSAIPSNYKGIAIAQGDRLGCSLRFPQKWLLLPLNIHQVGEKTAITESYTGPPKSLIDAVHQALLPHLHISDLSADRAAKLCGYDSRALARKLKAKGTTIGKEIARLRQQQATLLLKESDLSVLEIAGSVGFTDASVFSRAFRKWTGLSPSEYRKQYKVT